MNKKSGLEMAEIENKQIQTRMKGVDHNKLIKKNSYEWKMVQIEKNRFKLL